MRRGSVLQTTIAAGLAVLGLAAAAPAASADYASASYGGAVFADSYFTWKSPTRVEPMDLYVADTKCDGDGVYGFFRVYYYGGHWNTQPRRRSGCNTASLWNGLYINDARGIVAIRLYACVDRGSFNPDPCSGSARRYSPFFTTTSAIDPDVDGTVHMDLPDEAWVGPDGVVASEG